MSATSAAMLNTTPAAAIRLMHTLLLVEGLQPGSKMTIEPIRTFGTTMLAPAT